MEERRTDALLVEPHDREHRPAVADLLARLRPRSTALQRQPDKQHRLRHRIRQPTRTARGRQRTRSGNDDRRHHGHAGPLFDHRSQRCGQPAIQLPRLQAPDAGDLGQHDERNDAGGHDRNGRSGRYGIRDPKEEYAGGSGNSEKRQQNAGYGSRFCRI